MRERRVGEREGQKKMEMRRNARNGREKENEKKGECIEISGK